MSVQMVIELRDRESAQTVIRALDAYKVHLRSSIERTKRHLAEFEARYGMDTARPQPEYLPLTAHERLFSLPKSTFDIPPPEFEGPGSLPNPPGHPTFDIPPFLECPPRRKTFVLSSNP